MPVFLRWCPTVASWTALSIVSLTFLVPALPIPGLRVLLLGFTILAVATLLIDVRLTRRSGTRLPSGAVFGVWLALIAAAAVVGADFVLWPQPDEAGADIGIGFVWLLGTLFLPIGALMHLCTTPRGTPARGLSVWGRRIAWALFAVFLAYLAYPFLPLGG